MAATQTVAQPFPLRKFVSKTSELKPRHGVITLSGYGISMRVERGHLLLEDGIGGDRRRCRISRVDHRLKRLVVIGSDGVVSLSALRWLADRDASFVMLDRDGSVLTTTGPVRSSDVRLRRAQVLALQNGAALRISRQLIDWKLAGQERVATEGLQDESAALTIGRFRSELADAESIDAIRLIEAQAARIYWTAWQKVKMLFPRKDLPRVPEHWRTFGSRMSLLTGAPRLATNPANAMLNYLYAVLEAETRLAAAKLGLDPGMGVLHADTQYRDSLACDLMEPVRPNVDAFVLDWLKREPLLCSDFFEQRDGSCRLMAPFTSKLSQTAQTWEHLVGPLAEWFAREVCKAMGTRQPYLPSRLTQRLRREAKGVDPFPKAGLAFESRKICRGCGKEIQRRRTHCHQCSIEVNTERLAVAANLGRVASHATDAAAKRAATQRTNAQAAREWTDTDQPGWLTNDFYIKRIQPILSSMPCSRIAKALNVSRNYSNQVRKGRIPHARHWGVLAQLVGVRSD